MVFWPKRGNEEEPGFLQPKYDSLSWGVTLLFPFQEQYRPCNRCEYERNRFVQHSLQAWVLFDFDDFTCGVQPTGPSETNGYYSIIDTKWFHESEWQTESSAAVYSVGIEEVQFIPQQRLDFVW